MKLFLLLYCIICLLINNVRAHVNTNTKNSSSAPSNDVQQNNANPQSNVRTILSNTIVPVSQLVIRQAVNTGTNVTSQSTNLADFKGSMTPHISNSSSNPENSCCVEKICYTPCPYPLPPRGVAPQPAVADAPAAVYPPSVMPALLMPAEAYYEPVVHDHPNPSLLKAMIRRDKKRIRRPWFINRPSSGVSSEKSDTSNESDTSDKSDASDSSETETDNSDSTSY